MAGAWALIGAKQCVSVFDCVVFVCEMGRCRCYWMRTLLVARCGIVGGNCVGGDGGLGVSRPFFYFRLVWLVCDDAGWRVRGR